MYIPTFNITHRLVEYLIKLELSARSIKDIPLPSNEKLKILNDSESEALFQISKLAEVPVSLRKAKDIASQGHDILNENPAERLLSNYRSCWDFMFSSTNEKYVSLSPSLLLHLNKLLFDGVVESWEIGRFRSVKDDINKKYDSFFDVRNKEYDTYDFEKEFYEILNWYSSSQYKIHPAIKTAVVLYEILQSYPFLSGNMITAISVGELLFERTYLSLKHLFALPRTFVNYKDELKEALSVSIKQNGDQTRWIEEFVRGLALDMTELKNEILQVEQEKVGKKKKKFLGLNTRQLRLMKWLQKKEKIYRRDYVKRMGVSTMTAYRDLNELLKRKLILLKGGGRSTYYTVYKDTEPIGDSNFKKSKVVKVINDLE
ncbi:MAG: Fic family protein [bacterium]